ncbi:response regulator transcription factor [Novosphingobium flavum]|uniref:Response regulator transcription factor n=1 Tax=Novosphingobium flavum TaxID=1778672 RepID=A0A7X1KM86_9SPHN|nr:response regulator transcription factor [Novosphingobium flavum]MBC2666118.1 response regulator transcription factor [Novosphingobium flavum]
MKRVLLVDDHPLFRQALAATVQRINKDITVEQYGSLASVRVALEEHPAPDLILLDLNLADCSGMVGLPALKGAFPDIPIAIVSANDDPEMINNAIICGAAGYISKAVAVTELSAAIECLLEGEEWFEQDVAPGGLETLTPTQMRILDAVQRGLMYKQIAFEVGICEATVKYHLANIFKRLGVKSRAQLLALSCRT